MNGAAGPTAVAYEPGTGNLWVLEKGAGSSTGTARVRVRHAVSGVVSTALTLDCVDSRGERGLLGIAFAPDFATSRHVFLFYIRRINATGTCSLFGESVASRMRVSRFVESGLTFHSLGGWKPSPLGEAFRRLAVRFRSEHISEVIAHSLFTALSFRVHHEVPQAGAAG